MEKEQKNRSEINPKLQQLQDVRVDGMCQKMTTDMGIKVTGTDDTLKAGLRGPSLLEDFHFREKITHFDHERIPERVVHARGFGVHGEFELYESMSGYTKAKFLQDPKVKTPVFVRFSTVVGSRGSADTSRDVRGFAVKFYTEDGNYDLVGNNMPVFFIQDAIKFPDLIHAVKPEPMNEIPQATSAHDTFWDFVVNTPETAHMVMWVMSDRAIPRSFRMMEGFGVNTFRFVNDKGVSRFVKFHWKPVLGVHSLVRDEAQKIAGKDPDFHRRDLYDCIEKGRFAEYEFGVQMIEESQEFAFDFDILDPTKLWPEELVPVKIFGKMTLNKNTENFFAETEQAAFCPANIVPGIDFSNDPLLQGRLFSYLDTQLLRLGGPNFHQIPINKPIVPTFNNQRDGFHRATVDVGKAAYSPNSLGQDFPEVCKENEGFTHYPQKVEGEVIRTRSDSFKDFFSQARLFWNSMSAPEREHIIDAFRYEAGSVKEPKLRQRVADMFANVSVDLATAIAKGMGVVPPTEGVQEDPKAPTSPALSQMNTVKSSKTRKLAILAEPGFCEKTLSEALAVFENEGICCDIISCNQGELKSANNTQAYAIKDFKTTDPVLYDAVFIPAGQESSAILKKTLDARNFVNEIFKHCKTVAACGEGVDFLMMTDAKNVLMTDSKEQKPAEHMGVVIGRDTNQLKLFAKMTVQAIAKCRHFERKPDALV